MRRPDGHRVTAAAVLIVALVLWAPDLTTAQANAQVGDPAIPPGQEELLLAMLGKGAILPEGCTLTEGKVEYAVAEAHYRCPSGPVSFTVVHSSQAEPSDIQTEHFAIAVRDGAPPEGLADALAVLIQDREDEFEWVWPARENAEVAEAQDSSEEPSETAPEEPSW